MEALIARSVSVSFARAQALRAVTLDASAGQITGLLGPNGAGKTTFIRCCTGVVEPDNGTIELLGYSPGSRQARERVGVMPQSAGAWTPITARRLLNYLASLYRQPHDVDELMALLGIDTFPDTAYRHLSGGQQQAVNLAGSLIGRPHLVFLDEPTAGLDVRARNAVWEVMRRLRDSGVAVVLSTHDLLEAEQLCDRIVLLNQGATVAQGTVAELTAGASLESVYLTYTQGAA